MEPDTILARNYINGLIGWVDLGLEGTVANETTIIINDPDPSQDTDAKQIIILE